MNSKLQYVPIFRGRKEELATLQSFDFGERIYPCLEIVKEVGRRNKNEDKQYLLFDEKREKDFENYYTSTIAKIDAQKVFIDLPVHLSPHPNMKKPTLLFLRSVITKRDKRTEYMKKLRSMASKVIPVISTYIQINGEMDSIFLQERELRKDFKVLAFRTFLNTFQQDIEQIKKCSCPKDFIIMDFEDYELDDTDGDIKDTIAEFNNLNCNIIIHRNQVPRDTTMAGLKHSERVESIDNSLPFIFNSFGGNSFSDYVGIKKDDITEGGINSPGFIFYDGVTNNFFGYRYQNGGHKKGEEQPDLAEFETTIVPAVISSYVRKKMDSDVLDYLGSENQGWQTIKNIGLGKESGKSAAKFKRISMQHYLHCIKQKIINGHFD